MMKTLDTIKARRRRKFLDPGFHDHRHGSGSIAKGADYIQCE
jgi:hypothetical protein